MDIIITFIFIFFIFGLLVGIHEFGHFIVAKKCGVWVQEFAFGFGPTLFRKKWKGTIYKINLVPLGGYVKLFGERKLTKDNKFLRKFEKLDDSKEDYIVQLAEKYDLAKIKDEYVLFEKVSGLKNVKEKDKELLMEYELNKEYRIVDDKRYSNKSIGKRAFIISAGVIMNLLLGIFIYSIYLIIVNQKVLLFNMATTNFVGSNVVELNAPVFIDEDNMVNSEIDYFNAPIIKADGKYINDLNQFVDLLKNDLNKPIKIEYYKNGVLKSGEIGNEINSKLPKLNDSLKYSGGLGVGSIIEDSAASRAGFESDIVLLSAAGFDINSYEAFTKVLEENQSKNIVIEYLDLETNTTSTKEITLGNKSNDELIFGATGFYEYYPFSFFPSYYLDYSDYKIISGVLHSYNITKYQYDVFANILRYSFETKDTTLLSESVGGPIKIGSEIGNLVKLGNFTDILNLTALISLSLAVMNVLPIPIVDGGHLLFLLIEKIKGSPISERVQGIFNMIGLVFLVSLSLLVTLKDIWSLFI
ncbi:site-2 protease family protein [Candidatus Dojkabacteria bacterium]|nr:site-2 protease family protein [Candidatus Dojkabacteria bacterium]